MQLIRNLNCPSLLAGAMSEERATSEERGVSPVAGLAVSSMSRIVVSSVEGEAVSRPTRYPSWYVERSTRYFGWY